MHKHSKKGNSEGTTGSKVQNENRELFEFSKLLIVRIWLSKIAEIIKAKKSKKRKTFRIQKVN